MSSILYCIHVVCLILCNNNAAFNGSRDPMVKVEGGNMKIQVFQDVHDFFMVVDSHGASGCVVAKSA